MGVGGFFPAVFAVHIRVDHAAFQRSGAIKCHEGDDVANIVRFKLFEQFTDAVTFQLKNALCIAALQQLIDIRVVEVQFSQIYALGVIPLNHAKGIFQHGEGSQTKKIHLQQAGLLQIPHHPLGGYGKGRD